VTAPSGYVIANPDEIPANLITPTATSQQAITDYWSGPPEAQRWYFPDGVQYLEWIPLNHGGRAAYQRATQVDMNIDHRSKDVKIKGNLGADVDALVNLCTIDWKMFRGGQQVTFSRGVDSPGALLNQWLKQADPALVDRYVQVLRRANPWLTSELTVEEIDQQIEDLKALRLDVEKVVEGK
jgi:hypothetical protein